MTGFAAPLGDRIEATTTHHPHPGEAVRFGCPACKNVDSIIIEVETRLVHEIEAYGIRGISEPEYDITATTMPAHDEPVRKIHAAACTSCHWRAQRTDALAFLVAP